MRYCYFKASSKNIETCPGEVLQFQQCLNPLCISEWSEWKPKNCPLCYNNNAENLQTRIRKCLAANKIDCKQTFSESRTCDVPKCEEKGDWSEWNPATQCPECYRYGSAKPTIKLTRSCKNPLGCDGNAEKHEECDVAYCKRDLWSEWSAYSLCKDKNGRNCGRIGQRKRTRTCFAGKGKCSPGHDYQHQICTLKKC